MRDEQILHVQVPLSVFGVFLDVQKVRTVPSEHGRNRRRHILVPLHVVIGILESKVRPQVHHQVHLGRHRGHQVHRRILQLFALPLQVILALVGLRAQQQTRLFAGFGRKQNAHGYADPQAQAKIGNPLIFVHFR